MLISPAWTAQWHVLVVVLCRRVCALTGVPILECSGQIDCLQIAYISWHAKNLLVPTSIESDFS